MIAAAMQPRRAHGPVCPHRPGRPGPQPAGSHAAVAPRSRIWAVIKADAYGQGMVAGARALTRGGDGLAVARVGEAVALREAGIDRPCWFWRGRAPGRR